MRQNTQTVKNESDGWDFFCSNLYKYRDNIVIVNLSDHDNHDVQIWSWAPGWHYFGRTCSQKIGQASLNIYIGHTGVSENVFSIHSLNTEFKLLYYMNVFSKYPDKILHHLPEFP